jgi:hypothetical protein
MNNPEMPASLDEACHRFSQFLRENDYPEQILWVEQSDVVWSQRHLSVRARSAQTVRERACQRYEEGIKNGRGVSLHAFSELGENAVAVVIVPRDDEVGHRHLIPTGGLKLSVATKKLEARRIANRLIWLILSWRHRTTSRSFRNDYLGCL